MGRGVVVVDQVRFSCDHPTPHREEMILRVQESIVKGKKRRPASGWEPTLPADFP